MADDAVNALIPVAAVVHIALGVMALMLVRKTVDREWNEIYAGYVISWMMIVLGLQYTFATILDLKIDDFTAQDILNGAYTNLFSSSYKYSEQALNSIFIGLSFILPLIYPYPLLQKENAIKVTTFLVVVICILIIPLDIFSDFSNRDMKGSINWICYLIWIPIYLRFLVGEMLYMEENARTVSSVALLLILSFNSQVFGAGSDSSSSDSSETGLYDQAVKLVKRAGKLEKKDKADKAKKIYSQAFNKLEKAYSSDKKNPDILNYMGYTSRKVGNFKEAENYYLKGLDLDPKHNGINEYLGELYVQTNRIDKANERLAVLKNCNCDEYSELELIIKTRGTKIY